MKMEVARLLVLPSCIRAIYVLASALIVYYAVQSHPQNVDVVMGVSLALAGLAVLAEFVADVVTWKRRQTMFKQWSATVLRVARQCEEEIAIPAGSPHMTREPIASSPELKLLVCDNSAAFSQLLEQLVASHGVKKSFIPQPARISERRFSVSPAFGTGEPLIQLEQMDDGSFGRNPNGSAAVDQEQMAKVQHIQQLLVAIRQPDRVDEPPLPSLERGESPPPTKTGNSAPDVLRSPTRLLNDSFGSPVRKRLVASPRVSPSGVRGAVNRGTFRGAERHAMNIPAVDSTSAAHYGTVLVLQLWPPADAEDLLGSRLVEAISTSIGDALNLIADYGGVVYYFDLQRVVATFHVQQPCVDHSKCAVFAGLAISHVFESLSEDENIMFGVGISQGLMLAGDVGTDQIRSCVLHGPPVQEACDLAALNLCLQTRVLISESLHDSVQNGVVTMLVDFVASFDSIPHAKHLFTPIDSSDCRSVFEVRGGDCSFEESNGDGIAMASRLPHEVLVAYLEAFFFLRKGEFVKAANKLVTIPPEFLESDPQIQRILRIVVYFRDHPSPPPAYVRSPFSRWEGFEALCDQDVALRQASPSFAGRKAAKLSYESPTRIIEAVMRARSVSVNPALQPDPLSLSDLDATVGALNNTLSSEFADVSGVLWRKSDKVLGKGAFGEVFLGMRVEDGKLVAIKQLKIPEIISTSQPLRLRRTQQREKHELEALVREIRMLCNLRHPNIVFFLGCGVVNHDILINLEYVSGGSLQSILEEFGCLPLPATQRYLKDVLRGLDFLHTRGIIHRDVKPGNVLLHVDGGCKVTDFGTSIQIQNILDNNIVVGTPLYMSPEQAKGSKTTCYQSDLWSVGIMTIQLLTGALPFDVQGAVAAHQHMHRLATDDDFTVVIPHNLPGAAVGFVSQCLKRDPAARGSAQELLLHPFLFAASTPSHPTPLRQKSSRFSSSPPSSDTGGSSPLIPVKKLHMVSSATGDDDEASR